VKDRWLSKFQVLPTGGHDVAVANETLFFLACWRIGVVRVKRSGVDCATRSSELSPCVAPWWLQRHPMNHTVSFAGDICEQIHKSALEDTAWTTSSRKSITRISNPQAWRSGVRLNNMSPTCQSMIAQSLFAVQTCRCWKVLS
jgi:hypothetical protein